jgi:addiction module HigA family antidote
MPVRKAKHDPVHPGEVLLLDFLEPMGISRYRLAKETGMPADRVGKLVQGVRGITADSALRLARFFGTTAAFWMSLQAQYDLETTNEEYGARIERRIKPWKAA